MSSSNVDHRTNPSSVFKLVLGWWDSNHHDSTNEEMKKLKGVRSQLGFASWIPL